MEKNFISPLSVPVPSAEPSGEKQTHVTFYKRKIDESIFVLNIFIEHYHH